MSITLQNNRTQTVNVWEEVVTIPTYETPKPDKNPQFFDKRVYQGSSGKVYPLPVTETLSDVKVEKEYHAVFMENEYIKIMVLPELGGRIHRATDKTNGYEFVYYNRVIKPALVGLAGPWISGGIEFNWPQHHRPSTFLPVDYHIESHHDGSQTVWVGEIDRMYGTKGMAGFTLYPDRAYIEIKGQLYNRTPMDQTFLWWANPAVAVNEHTFSVFPPDVHAVMDHGKRAVSTFPISTGEYYQFDYSAGVDISRYKNIQVPTSYMAYHSNYDFIGNYDESKQAGLMHIADHHISPGKKQWTWGNGDFGQAWDDNLTDDDGPYIELMTGVYTDNQPDFTWLKPHEEKTFTQYFMPYKHVGEVTWASKDIIVRYQQKGPKVELAVYATAYQRDALVEISQNNSIIFEQKAQIGPKHHFNATIPWDVNKVDIYETVCTIRGENGIVLASFSPEKQQDKPIPQPAEPLPPPGDIKSVEQLYLAATHLMQYRHASFNPIDYYLEGLRREPSDIRLNDGYGMYLFRQGLFKDAIIYFERAVKKLQWKNPNPYTTEPFYHMGLAYWMLGDFDRSYEHFYKAIWSAEMQNVGWYRLACLESRKGQYERALESVEKSLVYNWHDMKGRVLKAYILRKLGKYNESWIAESRKIDLLDHGVAYEAALSSGDFDTWISSMSGDRNSYLTLAFLYEEFGELQEALKVLTYAPSEDAMINYTRGYFIKQILGTIEEADHYYQRAEVCSPDYVNPNTLEEMRVLQYAIAANPEGANAYYYLGNFYYDTTRHAEALQCWEESARLNPHFATVHRNLSIAYHNVEHDKERAFDAIRRAQELDPADARILLECDQLAEVMGQSPRQRLLFLDQFRTTVDKRDDLYLRRITLLNSLGHYQRAYDAIMRRTFHPWEGGEGLVSAQYVYSLIHMAQDFIDNHEERKAIALLEQTFTWPRNLGEGRLPQTQDTIANYYLGIAYDGLGMSDEARLWWKKASVGLEKPKEAHYYNDQPSDTIFYQGLACMKLGDEQTAKKRFNALASYGTQHQFDVVQADYFAVSLPQTSVYHTDVQENHIIHCRYHLGLGKLGLGDSVAAQAIFTDILEKQPSHQGAIDATLIGEKWPDS